MPKFGIKNAFFGYFWVTILKEVLPYLKSAPLNLSKNTSLTYTVNSGIGSSFSKVPGSTFHEDLGPGPGPLY